MYGLLWAYDVTPEGFEVKLFGLALIYRLRRENIVAAHVIKGLFNFSAVRDLGSHPWNTLRMGNRVRHEWVLLEKRWWPRFLAISPENPHDFVNAITAKSKF